jgi:transposase-like protein
MAHTDETKAQCLRLRIEERLSIPEISKRVKVAKSTLSLWLKDLPLTKEERDRKRHVVLRKDRGEPSKFVAMAPERLTRAQKARIAEAAVLFRLALQGWSVFGSPFDGDRSDWWVDVGGIIKRVQVKWAREAKQGLPSVPLQCSVGAHGRRVYLAGEMDVLVGYDFLTDTAYVWKWEEIRDLKSAVTVTPDAAERWDKLRR